MPSTAAKSSRAKPAVAKKVAVHPPYRTMVTKAVAELKDRGGSSRQAIRKYLQENFGVDDAQATRHLSLAIRTGVENGEFIQPKGPSGGLKLNKEHGKISSATRKPPTAAKSKAAAPVKKVSTKSAVDKPKGTKAKSTTARKVAAKKTAAKSATKKVAPKKRASPKKRTTPKMAPSLTQKKESGSAERAARAARRA